MQTGLLLPLLCGSARFRSRGLKVDNLCLIQLLKLVGRSLVKLICIVGLNVAQAFVLRFLIRLLLLLSANNSLLEFNHAEISRLEPCNSCRIFDPNFGEH